MIKNIAALSLFFAHSLLKEKANFLLLFFALLSAAVSTALSGTDIAVKHKLFEDLLLTTQSSLLLIAGLFYAYTLLQKEKTKGLYVLPLASGVTRFAYQAALFKAPNITTFMLFLLFVLCDSVILYLTEGEIKSTLLLQLFLYYLAASFLISLTVFLSRFVSVMNASLYSVIFFVIGNALDELLIYAKTLNDATLLFVSKILYVALPNFSLFDYQSAIVNGARLDYSDIAISIVYFMTYVLALGLGAYVKFRHKALNVGA